MTSRLRDVTNQLLAGSGFVRHFVYSVPESDVHMTEMIMIIPYATDLATIPALIIAAALANSSSTSLSAKFIFGARNFHLGL